MNMISVSSSNTMVTIISPSGTLKAMSNRVIRIIDMILNPTKPELILNPSIKDFFEFDNSKDLKDIKVKNYKHMGTIKFPVAQ